MHKGILALAAGMASLLLTAAAADTPGTTPDDFGDNPALPSTADLVMFDDAPPASTAPPVNVDALAGTQKAFPVYYGAMPASVTPAYQLAGEPLQQPQTASAAPLRPPESRPPAAPDPASDPGDGTHLAMAPAGNAAAAGGGLPAQPPAARPTPKNDAPPDNAAPAPAARRTPADAPGNGGGDAPAFKPDQALDGTPLPPPPLPELRGIPVQAAPVDITLVRAEFNRLKAFCDEDSLGSAAEVYANMPGFGSDEEVNRLRADAANLLILGLSREDNLSAARRIYDSVPLVPAGRDATLAKARGVINLATYYVRAERYSDAYDVLMDIGNIPDRSALNNELFRLMARMIPYLDNADQTDKAAAVFDLLLGEVNSPGTAALFAENAPGVFKYYLHYVDKSEAPRNRRMRLDFLEHAFAAMERHAGNPDIAMARKTLGESLAARYAGDPERAARFYVED